MPDDSDFRKALMSDEIWDAVNAEISSRYREVLEFYGIPDALLYKQRIIAEFISRLELIEEGEVRAYFAYALGFRYGEILQEISRLQELN